jgi:hypothetical protein
MEIAYPSDPSEDCGPFQIVLDRFEDADLDGFFPHTYLH